MPRAIPADFEESAQEILVITNPLAGQLVAFVPKTSRMLVNRSPLLVHLCGYLPCIHQQAFDSMKALLDADTLIMRYYPDHNFPFHIFTEASDYQVGSLIMRNDLPVAYSSCKLPLAQKCHY